MLRWLAIGCVLATLAASTASAQVLPPSPIDVRQGGFHDPSSALNVQVLPSQADRVTQFAPFTPNIQPPACPFHGSPSTVVTGGYPIVLIPGNWLPAYGFDPYYNGGYTDGGLYGPGYPPLRVLPAESLYGPQVMRRFMEGDNGGPTKNARTRRAAASNAAKAARPTNAQAKARAGRFMKIGDQQFAQQKYHAAHERYRTAGETAGDVAEAFLRQGFALVAMGQFEPAGRALRRGLRIRTDWHDAAFRLDDLYGGDDAAKAAHLATLEQSAENNPHDANVMLVTGLAFYFDGQLDRAGTFFERCDQLGGNSDHLLDAFLGAERAAARPNGAPARVEF